MTRLAPAIRRNFIETKTMTSDIRESAILCVANSYNKKYYLNPAYSAFPEGIKEELQIACVVFTEAVGGIITLFFDDEGNLTIATSAEDYDPSYDEIGADLKVKELRSEKADLFSAIETYYKVKVLGQPLPEE